MSLRYAIESADGVRLCAHDWRPDGDAVADVLLVHGLGEHLGRYEHVGRTLAARGARVLGVDLRGHGHSDGRRGHVRRFDDYARDLDAAAELLQRPLLVLAHSMGGLVTLDWLRARADAAGALVLSSPLLDVAVQSPAWMRTLAAALARLWPTLPLDNQIKLEDLCTDEEVVETFRRDALRVSTVTPRWFLEMQAARRRVWEHLPDYRAPLHLHLAEDERVVDASAARRFRSAWPAASSERTWPGTRHELLQEDCAEELLAGIPLMDGSAHR